MVVCDRDEGAVVEDGDQDQHQHRHLEEVGVLLTQLLVVVVGVQREDRDEEEGDQLQGAGDTVVQGGEDREGGTGREQQQQGRTDQKDSRCTGPGKAAGSQHAWQWRV